MSRQEKAAWGLAAVLVFGGVYEGLSAFGRAIVRDAATAQAHLDREEAPMLTACAKAGGIIIRSGWTQRIIDCKVIR